MTRISDGTPPGKGVRAIGYPSKSRSETRLGRNSGNPNEFERISTMKGLATCSELEHGVPHGNAPIASLTGMSDTSSSGAAGASSTPSWMTSGSGGGGFIPPPPTSTPALLVIIAVITMLWSVGCGCFQAVGFTAVEGFSVLHDQDPAELEKAIVDGLNQSEQQALTQEVDETQREHIKSAYVFMRKHTQMLSTSMVRVSGDIRNSGVATLLGLLTLCNLPYLISAVLLLGRRRIGKTLLVITSTAIILLVAGVVIKLGGPVESMRVTAEEFIRKILESPDAMTLDVEARRVLEVLPKSLMVGLTAVNLGTAVLVSFWPIITLLVGGLSKKIDQSCDQ